MDNPVSLNLIDAYDTSISVDNISMYHWEKSLFSTIKKILKLTLFAIIISSITSCGLKISLNNESDIKSSKNIISGVVTPLSASISSNDSSFFFATANAIACADPVYAKLFVVKNDGSIDESNPLASQLVSAGARYTFDGAALGLTNLDNVQYIIKAQGCNDDIYKRPVTDFNDEQDLDAKTTIVSEVVNANTLLSTTLNRAKRAEVEALIKSMSGASISSALNSITTETGPVNKFTEIFGVSPSVIQDGKPGVSLSSPSSFLNELTVNTFSAQAYHIDPNYSVAYSWKLNSIVKSHSNYWSYTPSANESGFKTIDFYAGKDDGNGNIDLTKPYYTKSFSVYVNNNILPTAPAIALNSSNPSPVSSNTISVDVTTGVALANCANFSHLAITDSNTTPGVMQFTIDCTASGTQTESVIIPNTDGAKSLYIWAIDNEGEISSPSLVSFVKDSDAPIASLTFLPTAIKGGSTQTVTFSASDAGVGLSTLALYYSATGANPYTLVSILGLTATSYSWSTPSADTTAGKLKLTAVDLTGKTTDVFSSTIIIDSTPPTAPIFTRTSSAITNSTSVTSTITSCADISSVLINESATAPLSSASGWSACSTAASNYTHTVSGQGLHTIYAWAMDSLGNISTTANSITMTLDTVLPTIAITTPVSLKGNGNFGSLAWTLTEANVASSTTFTVEIFDGTSWASVGTPSANTGSNASQAYSLSNFSVPNVNVTNAKMRVSLTDAAGNLRATESNTFTIDSTPPVVASITINDGAVYAGTAMVNAKVNVTDNYSTGSDLKVRLSLSNNGTDNCQSEYADNNWQAWTNSTTNIPFNFAPTDGVKKICAWAKDLAGNVSAISPTAGTAGTNFDTITFSVGHPPEISSFEVVRTSDSSAVAFGTNPLTISWSASDFEGLDNNPISFSYTTNNTLWKDITTNLDASNPANVTWVGNISGNPTTASGSVTSWVAPGLITDKPYFRVRAQVKDMAGNTSIVATSQTFNTETWSVYAGSTHRGDGGTGKASALYGAGYYSHFAINPINGDIYSIDNGVGIRKLNAATGIVSTYMVSGALNLPDDGPLPATPRIPIDNSTNPYFDSKGRLYLGVPSGGTSTAKIYQIDIANSYVRKYAGGGLGSEGGLASTALQIASGGYNFDEQDSLYVWAYCGNAVVNATNYQTVGFRIIKIAQNADGTPGTTTRVIGNCSFGAITSGATAYDQPAMAASASYAVYSGIIPWDNGNKILILPYTTGARYKIINGVTYTTNIASSYSTGIGKYNPADGLIYKTNSTGVEKVSVNTSGNNGDVATQYFNTTSTAAGCTADEVTPTTFCGLVLAQFDIRSGVVYFADGAGQNAASSYAIRYFDGTNKLRTVFGSQPFYGHGMNKSLMRGLFSGIAYKRAGDDNLTAFPEGLYFVERSGLVFGHIHPTTGIVSNLWGNQSKAAVALTPGMTLSKDISMGGTYAGNGYTLTFDDDGFPWMRAQNNAISIDANHKLVVKSTGVGSSVTLTELAGTTDPTPYSLYVYAGIQNFTLKDQGLFLLPNYVTTGVTPKVTIRYYDYLNLVSPVLIGGTYRSNAGMPASADVGTPGSVAAAPLSSACINSAPCYVQYHKQSDRLYFSEVNKLRFITTATTPSTSTLGTAVGLPAGTSIYNFAFTEDESQLWYFRSDGGLYCYNISSPKSWCDNTTDYFQIRTIAGFTVSAGANQMTFKDNETMFVSTYNGEILKFTVPTN